jgi:hypothetical protein
MNKPDPDSNLIPIPDLPYELLGHLLPDEFAYPDIDFVEIPLQVDPWAGLKLRLTLNHLIVRLHISWETYQRCITCTAYVPGASVRCFNLEYPPYLDVWSRILATAVVNSEDPAKLGLGYSEHVKLIRALGELFGRIIRKNMGEGNFSDSSAR